MATVFHFEPSIVQPHGPPEAYAQDFFTQLRSRGYTENSIRKRRSIITAFLCWAQKEHLGTVDLNESHASTFASRSSGRTRDNIKSDHAAVQLFVDFLGTVKDCRIPDCPTTVVPVEALYRRYIAYLRNDKGLAENSILVYRHYIHDFLTDMDHAAGALAPTEWTAMTIQHYILEHTKGRSAEYSRLLAVALRSFLRFLYFCGDMVADMARSISMTRKYSQATVPSLLSSDEVERIVATTNRPSVSGTRDRAILLLLARLGLRAGEITTLELDDIRWRTAEIVIKGKGRTMNTLPLLSDVGEALTLYLRTDRPLSTSRRVFLRTVAPNVGFAGPAAIGHIVRAALVRAGIHRTTRGAAHIFRHALATRMIRSGASLTEIGEVLRHRSQSSTMIYAKVSFESLRGVARPWPQRGSPS